MLNTSMCTERSCVDVGTDMASQQSVSHDTAVTIVFLQTVNFVSASLSARLDASIDWRNCAITKLGTLNQQTPRRQTYLLNHSASSLQPREAAAVQSFPHSYMFALKMLLCFPLSILGILDPCT